MQTRVNRVLMCLALSGHERTSDEACRSGDALKDGLVLELTSGIFYLDVDEISAVQGLTPQVKQLVSIPQVMEGNFGVRCVPQERSWNRALEQILDVTVPQKFIHKTPDVHASVQKCFQGAVEVLRMFQCSHDDGDDAHRQ